MLQIAAAALVIIATIMYYSWILIGSEQSKTLVSLFAYEQNNAKQAHAVVTELVQTASRVRYGFAQIFASQIWYNLSLSQLSHNASHNLSLFIRTYLFSKTF